MINLLSRIAVLRSIPAPSPCVVEIDGREVHVKFKRNARCKRMVLRVAKDGSGLLMTLPKRTSQAEALRFVQISKDWIIKNLASRKPPVMFEAGAFIPLRGALHQIECTGGRRGLVSVDLAAQKLSVPGEAAHVGRRVADWLKQQAVSDLSAASQKYATLMGVQFTAITVRDQNSRWGSCSSARALSYSWRLILAPPFVLNYVAAHEVAHILEMNHGPKFWRLVLTHCKNAKLSRDWLKKNGSELHRYQKPKSH